MRSSNIANDAFMMLVFVQSILKHLASHISDRVGVLTLGRLSSCPTYLQTSYLAADVCADKLFGV